MATQSQTSKPIDVSQKIAFDTGELQIIKTILLEYNTNVKNATIFLNIIDKINNIMQVVQKNEK